MRDLSRVFQGVLAVPHDSINTGGTRGAEGTYTVAPPSTLVNVWKHECERVFSDRMIETKDSNEFNDIRQTLTKKFFPDVDMVALEEKPISFTEFIEAREIVLAQALVCQRRDDIVKQLGSEPGHEQARLDFLPGQRHLHHVLAPTPRTWHWRRLRRAVA